MTSLRGDSTLASIVNKGICGERMAWWCVAAGCTNSRKSYAIVFQFPKIPKLRKSGNRKILRTIAETFVSSGRLLLSTKRLTEWTGVCSSHF